MVKKRIKVENRRSINWDFIAIIEIEKKTSKKINFVPQSTQPPVPGLVLQNTCSERCSLPDSEDLSRLNT